MSNEYQPSSVTAPGDTLLEIITDRSMTQSELAERLGLAPKTVNEIVKGKAPITHDTALSLERVLGVDAAFWNRYEARYREHVARQAEAHRLQDHIGWLNLIPWKEAADLGWMPVRANPMDQLRIVLAYFGVATPVQYSEVYGAMSLKWRRSQRTPGDPASLALWLRQGEIIGSQVETAPYDARRFEQCLISARRLTEVTDRDVFRHELRELCAEAGVAVVLIPELKKTSVCGAARWLSPAKALIQLSMRYETYDSLWFSFYHEAAHLLKHSKKDIFIDDEKASVSDQEQEADQYAEQALITPREYRRLIRLQPLTRARISQFAEEIGVAPGIVVGRLEHEGLLPGPECYSLRAPCRWDFS